MQNLLRPYAAMSVAALAAGAIAATPVAPVTTTHLPEIQLSASADGMGDVFQAITFLGEPNYDVMQPAAFLTTDLNHGFLWSTFNGIPPYGDGTPALDDDMLAVINFISSPISGVLIGALGPLLSPIVELYNSFQDILAGLEDGDFDQVLDALLAAPENVFDALLNGTTLDLSGLLPLFDDGGLFPPGALSGLDIALGGLLTEGVTIGDPADFDPADPENLGTGGSIFNAIGFAFPGDGSGDITGEATGLMSALTNLWEIVTSTMDLGAAD